MDFMNDFVEREWDNMHRYLMIISSLPNDLIKNENITDWNASVDAGKELCLLHIYLDEFWTQEVCSFSKKFKILLNFLKKLVLLRK